MARTAHAVGQGLFCTEQFTIRDGSLCVAYDCGAGTKTAFSRVLKSDLEPDQALDLLFMSHFDNDHINGLEELAKKGRVKTLVVPQYDPYKWYYMVNEVCSVQPGQHIGDRLWAWARFERLMERYHITVIQIPPSVPGEDLPEGMADASDFSRSATLKGGQGISFPSRANPLWCYYPVNLCQWPKVTELKQKLDKVFRNPTFDQMTTKDISDLLNDSTKREKVRNIYKEVFGTVNDSSMMVLSMANHDNQARCHVARPSHSFQYGLSYCCCSRCHPVITCENDQASEACLYTGDADLHNIYARRNLKAMSEMLEHVGVLQIPHHGSRHNLDLDAIDQWLPGIEACFASYDNANKYGHPWRHGLQELASRDIAVFEVTECRNTTYTESIYISRL